MKKYIFLIIAAFVLLFAVVGIMNNKALFVNNDPAIEQDASFEDKEESTDQSESAGEIVEIPVDSVNGITKTEAEEICYSVMGKKDADTGFAFSFGVSGAVEKDKKQYYVIRATWLVNNSHMSYIGDFFVSADGKELYNGFVKPGEYIMTDKIWSK